MRSRIKVLLTALVAVALLATVVGTASANLFSIDEQDIRVVFDELTLESDAGEIICEVTLEGTFHDRTFTKEEELLGFITRAIANDGACTDNVPISAPDGRVNQETLPWHITNEGWTGTLPIIDTVNLLLADAGFTVGPIFGIECFYDANVWGEAIPEGNETYLRSNSERVYESISPEVCPNGSFVTRNEGERITDLGGAEDILLRLI